MRTTLNLSDAHPGIVMAIHTFGEYLNIHPHLHALVADGLFTAETPHFGRAERAPHSYQAKVFPLSYSSSSVVLEIGTNSRKRTMDKSAKFCHEILSLIAMACTARPYVTTQQRDCTSCSILTPYRHNGARLFRPRQPVVIRSEKRLFISYRICSLFRCQ